jgi:hypothetical protein
MSSIPPTCQTITVVAFRGNRSKLFAATFQNALDAEKNGHGPGPSTMDCLLFAGHVGVSMDDGTTIFGFNPDSAGVPVWELMDGLRNGDAFPGVVRDDTAVFTAARNYGFTTMSFEVILPDPQFQSFKTTLDAERRKSQYSYGFPNGDGDCNCVTWLERLGLPLLTGSMNEFASLSGFLSHPSRRFGQCV